MNSRTFTVLARAKPGQKLAEAVLDQQGMVLLPAGAALTEQMLQHLHDRNITILSLETETPATTIDIAALEQHLNRLFRQAGDTHATQQLRMAIQRYRSEA